jgi:hypothetical protein
MEYIGIDVHQRESQLCVLDAVAEVVLERRIRTARDRFAALVGTRPPARVLLEASTESEWVARPWKHWAMRWSWRIRTCPRCTRRGGGA